MVCVKVDVVAVARTVIVLCKILGEEFQGRLRVGQEKREGWILAT